MSTLRWHNRQTLSWRLAAIVGLAALWIACAAAGNLLFASPGGGNLHAEKAVICDDFSSKSEAACLKRLIDIVSRKGDLLRVKLQNGKTKIYKSESQACRDNVVEKCVSYRLKGFFPTHQLILIQRAVYEGAPQDLLLSRKTGSELEIMGPPRFSASGIRFVSAGCDEEEAMFCGLGIWSIESDPAKLEWRYNGAGLEFKEWRGDDHVNLSVEQWNGNKSSVTGAELSRTNGKWIWSGAELTGEIQQ